MRDLLGHLAIPYRLQGVTTAEIGKESGHRFFISRGKDSCCLKSSDKPLAKVGESGCAGLE